MFSYNRFWHFWYTLDNRHYFRLFLAGLFTGLGGGALLAFLGVILPIVLVATIVSIPIVTIAFVTLVFTKLSDFFYNRQNKQLEELKHVEQEGLTLTREQKAYNEQIDLYLNRRVICPPELLEGKLLSFLKVERSVHESHDKIKRAFALDKDTNLVIAPRVSSLPVPNRNPISIATIADDGEQLFIKKTAALDGLSELAAREMAELMGFEGLIPSNTIARDQELGQRLPSTNLFTSREAVERVVAKRAAETAENEHPIPNTPGVRIAVEKFVTNLKAAAHRKQAEENPSAKLVYVQKAVPNAKDGLQMMMDLLCEPIAGVSARIPLRQRGAAREGARKLLQEIDLDSFQENFLLQIVLGSQDCNPGNTLFKEVTDAEGTRQQLYSVDHERIMPEDNYNMTKRTPVINGPEGAWDERELKDVFPIRLWLAGLPQAEIPFSRLAANLN